MQKTMLQKFHAFTLVELIVVITIVGILATVGFVSYSGYLTGARDSNRISQLTKLSDSLQVYAASKSLPLPDDKIDITASGTTIAYQGYVGVDVLETIDYTNGGKDPKDDSYYTYYLTKDRKNMQLLALMEEPQTVAYKGTVPSIANTYAATYEDRYPKVYGRKLGVLVSAEEDTLNTPAQEISANLSTGYLDVFRTSDEYTAVFGTRGNYSGTGNILGTQILAGGKLLGYWGFNEGSGTIVVDNSGNGNNGTHGGTTLPNYVSGVKGSALDFFGNPSDSTEGSKVVIDNTFDFAGSSTYSVGFWIQPEAQADPNDVSRLIVKTVNGDGDNFFEFSWDMYPKSPHLLQSCSSIRAGGRQSSQIKGSLDVSIWNHITCVYGSDYIATYVNGELNNKVSANFTNANKSYNSSYLLFGGGSHDADHGYFDGLIDEIYLFDTDLSSDQVELLYLNSK